MSAFVALSKINKRFGGVQALKDFDFSVERGEIHCLVGENGSGKSTLIKIIAGSIYPDSGEIVVENRRYNYLHPIDSINLGIRVIFQDFALFPNLTVAENIAYTHLVERNRKSIKWREIYSVAYEAMQKISVNLNLEEKVGSLSVADQQMVAICRALTKDIRFLILDEPTSALTRREIDQLFSVIKDLQGKSVSIMFVSHKLNEVLEIADRVTVIRDGRNVATLSRDEVTNEQLIYLMTGTATELYSYAAKSSLDGEKLLEIQNLYKRNVYQNVSFILHKGEILGITGPLGSGRTELAMTLFGLDPADGGKIFVEGKEAQIRSVQDAVRLGIGYVPENRLVQGLFMKKSVGENVAVVIINRFLNKLGLVNAEQLKSEIEAWVHKLEIKPANINIGVQALSGGNQQRVVLAKWLAAKPKILVLDNPTAGVDVAAKSSIHAIIRNMAEAGVGVLLISDEIPEIIRNCSRVVIMKNGKIVDVMNISKDVSEADIRNRFEGIRR